MSELSDLQCECDILRATWKFLVSSMILRSFLGTHFPPAAEWASDPSSPALMIGSQDKKYHTKKLKIANNAIATPRSGANLSSPGQALHPEDVRAHPGAQRPQICTIDVRRATSHKKSFDHKYITKPTLLLLHVLFLSHTPIGH